MLSLSRRKSLTYLHSFFFKVWKLFTLGQFTVSSQRPVNSTTSLSSNIMHSLIGIYPSPAPLPGQVLRTGITKNDKYMTVLFL